MMVWLGGGEREQVRDGLVAVVLGGFPQHESRVGQRVQQHGQGDVDRSVPGADPVTEQGMFLDALVAAVVGVVRVRQLVCPARRAKKSGACLRASPAGALHDSQNGWEAIPTPSVEVQQHQMTQQRVPASRDRLLLPVVVVHHGQAAAVRAVRARVLDAAYAAHPEWFAVRPADPPTEPQPAWINQPPREEDQAAGPGGSTAQQFANDLEPFRLTGSAPATAHHGHPARRPTVCSGTLPSLHPRCRECPRFGIVQTGKEPGSEPGPPPKFFPAWSVGLGLRHHRFPNCFELPAPPRVSAGGLLA